MRTLLAFFLALTLPVGLAAQSDSEQIVKTEVLAGWRMENGNHMMAVRFEMAPGWKTYWRAPGGSGIPPRFTWSRSQNLKGVRPVWPKPKMLDLLGATTLGYVTELILPIEVFPKDPKAPIKINGTVDFGVCEEICVPVQSTLRATLTPDSMGSVSDIKKALSKRVQPASRLGLQRVQCVIDPTSDGYQITAHAQFNKSPKSVHTVIEYQAAEVWVDLATTKLNQKDLTASAELMSFRDTPLIFQRDRIRLTIFADGKVGEVLGCPVI